MAKKVSWMWGGKRYSGTLIRETKTHKFARTKNGKIKKIKILNMKIDLNFFETKNHLYANRAVTAMAIKSNQKSWSGYENTNLKINLISCLA